MNAFPGRVDARRLIIGTALLAWGLVLLLDQTGIVYGRHAGALWPLIIIALGAGKMAGSDCRRGRRSGLWLLVIGFWLAVNEFTVLSYHDTWPLLIVAAGGMMVWDVAARRGAFRSETGGGQ